MCLSECDLGTYGDKCNETCGNCQDQTKCHHSNGTCLTGCSAGYDGALCKTRKYVKHCKYIYSYMYIDLCVGLRFFNWTFKEDTCEKIPSRFCKIY